jgi:hypothetical protein
MLLVVQYHNQIERRHAEIVQLRAQMITALSSIKQREASLLFNGEIMRIELRRLPDTPDKWRDIEAMPSLFAGIMEMKNEIDEFEALLGNMDTPKYNRSAVLLMLQSSAVALDKIVVAEENVEKRMLLMLASVRNKQQV